MNQTLVISRLKALADGTRLRILRLLEDHELSVSELTSVLGMTQSRVSSHLGVLKEAGYVTDRRQGTSSYYRRSPEGEGAAAWDALSPTLPELAEFREDRTRLAALLERRKERTREFFDRASEAWDDLRSESLGVHAGTAALAGLVPRRMTVLDLGTGTGGLLPVLADSIHRVVAVDFSRGMLERARVNRQLDEVTYLRADMEHLPLPDGSVDGAVANMVLHHLDDPRNMLREIARVLRPEGRGVIIDFESHDETWLTVEEGHRWAGFEPAQLGAWCLDAGLSIPQFRPVPTPEGGRWSRLRVFAARFERRSGGGSLH